MPHSYDACRQACGNVRQTSCFQPLAILRLSVTKSIMQQKCKVMSLFESRTKKRKMQRVKRIAIVIAIQLAAAALSLLNLLHLKLGNLLAPSQEATDVATQAAVGAIVVASIAAP